MLKKFYLFWIIMGVALVYCSKSYAFIQTYETDKVKFSIISSHDEIPNKQDLGFLLKFEMKNGWHIFAQNPGDIGLPTKVQWNVSPSLKLQKSVWSKFKRFDDEGIIQYGYDDVAYYQAFFKNVSNIDNEIIVAGVVNWLACKDECIPERFDFKFAFPKTKVGLSSNPYFEEEIKQAQKLFVSNEKNIQQQSFINIIFMAFLGGILLNFMPCIFPILSIKAISLAQSSINKAQSRIEALMYIIGVVSSFLIIATVLVWLRSKGEQIGWGFQLQYPWFVASVFCIFFVIFLMLLDVINVKNPFANKVGKISFTGRKINAFFTGFFAVLIASPCTAPFMGIAIGYTLVKPIYVYYPIFLSLGLGYALPFALIEMFPRFVYRFLPKPGKWMVTLKKIFAVPVFLTCVWLFWVFCNQIDVFTEKNSDLYWENVDDYTVKNLQQMEHPVFIDFTAKWCITCLINKKTALQSKAFKELVRRKNIRLFKADWTNQDEKISSALAYFGRNSVPLYVYYEGQGKDYKILPQLLTPAILEKYMD